ncbi:MAG: NAD(P)H-hydrate dehydratase [Thermoplasmata archaeon]
MKICKTQQMRDMDHAAISKFGIADQILMENAGNAVYFCILNTFSNVLKKKFAVFAGPGNNGGDGLVSSRKLISNGAEVKVFILESPDKYQGSAKLNFEIIKKITKIEKFEKNSAEEYVKNCDAIVDAIFGTGLYKNVEGKYADAISIINNSKKPVFSIDIPSGINGDSGKIMGIAVKADYTVTFGTLKSGIVLYPGFEYCGKIMVSRISFPPALYESESLLTEINDPVFIPARGKAGYKNMFGNVLVVAGSKNYYGAPYFSALSFLKAGGGYARLVIPESLIQSVSDAREIVFYPVSETYDGSVHYSEKTGILNLAELSDFVVLGPGLSLNAETQTLIAELASEIKKPILIDGDGLSAIADHPEILTSRTADTILTPHLGEMSRLAKKDINAILEDSIEFVRSFAQANHVYLVLKGAHTQIGTPAGKVYINMTGNVGMATAGSGDVLTGTIAAMHGLGLNTENAVRMGVFAHGLAGNLAAKDKGEDGMVARDILEHLPEALLTIRTRFEELKKMYGFEVI